jgi:hypothetical protein
LSTRECAHSHDGRLLALAGRADDAIRVWDPAQGKALHAFEGHRGGSGILVDEELARAVRHESAAAIMFWWGVGGNAVWSWRKALGVSDHGGTEGTRRLHQAACAKGAERLRGKHLSPEQVEQRQRTAHALNLGQYLEAARQKRAWPAKHLALLGKMGVRSWEYLVFG